MSHVLYTIVCGSLVGSQLLMAAESCVTHSPATTVALVELYTSEGCSSCPPADRWLSRIKQSGLGLDQVIPLSMHVDYWDSLGWKDRFASPTYTARQRALAQQAQSGFVYTPEIFVGRKEFRNAGSDERFLQRVAAINSQPAKASIEISLKPVSGDVLPFALKIAVKPEVAGHRLSVYAAIYEDDLTSRVNAGENSGTLLHHDHVVRRWIGPVAINGATQAYQSDMRIDPSWKHSALGVVAFVEDANNGEILQALATGLCTTAP
jgi:hypothetical protein